jgi:hypothetical protein
MRTKTETKFTAMTKVDLVNLYVDIVKNKPSYRFDPKKMILDLLPDKALLYRVFMPRRSYALNQSRQDHGKLHILEHRFINFLMFTDFSFPEIETIFQKVAELTSHESHMQDSIPIEWQYSVDELFSFLNEASPRNGSSVLATSNSVLSVKELDDLYGNSLERDL